MLTLKGNGLTYASQVCVIIISIFFVFWLLSVHALLLPEIIAVARGLKTPAECGLLILLRPSSRRARLLSPLGPV